MVDGERVNNNCQVFLWLNPAEIYYLLSEVLYF